MENKLLTKLKNAYKKRSKQLNKKFTDRSDTGLLLFVEHLKYLRDCLILKTTLETSESFPEADLAMTAITVAVAEFEAYQKSEDEVQKDLHLNSFWELVKINIKGWTALNDTI